MHLPDLIIADGRLRGGSGVAAMEQILRRGDVAHIFVTGDPGEIEQRMPGAIILQKPFNEAGLERALRSVTLNDDVVTVQICGASEAQATRSL
jgi:CheY-like chemotaxis protein